MLELKAEHRVKQSQLGNQLRTELRTSEPEISKNIKNSTSLSQDYLVLIKKRVTSYLYLAMIFSAAKNY